MTYQWVFGDGDTTILQVPQHNYDTSGTYFVQLTVTSDWGCEDLIMKPVIVYRLPIVSAGSDTSVSKGHEVQLQAKGGVSCFWQPFTALNNSVIFTPVSKPLEICP